MNALKKSGYDFYAWFTKCRWHVERKKTDIDEETFLDEIDKHFKTPEARAYVKGVLEIIKAAHLGFTQFNDSQNHRRPHS